MGTGLVDHEIGTSTTPSPAGAAICVIGKYNVAGGVRAVEPLEESLGIRDKARITGDGRYETIAAALLAA